jgi:hypothetical protein
MTDSIVLSQAEIDYLCNCTRYLYCYTVDRDELVRKLTSLRAGSRKMENLYPPEEE